jgi:hypothetical protein
VTAVIATAFAAAKPRAYGPIETFLGTGSATNRAPVAIGAATMIGLGSVTSTLA